MKKVIFSLLAVMACLSINAQRIMVFNKNISTTTPVAEYTNSSEHKYVAVLAEASKGVAAVSEEAGITGNEVQWVQLWKNGPKWAVFNVGAKSASEYGSYYYWGSTDCTNYCEGTSDIQGTEYDTAKKIWGDNWKLPTMTDYDNLLNDTYTDVEWKSADESGYGVAGLLVKGKGDYVFNSLFFPESGFYKPYDNSIHCQGTTGSYWASTPNGSNAYLLNFTEETKSLTYDSRNSGMTIRAILK